MFYKNPTIVSCYKDVIQPAHSTVFSISKSVRVRRKVVMPSSLENFNKVSSKFRTTLVVLGYFSGINVSNYVYILV